MGHKVKGSFSYTGPERRKHAAIRSSERWLIIILCVLWVVTPAASLNIVELWVWLKGVIPLGY